MDPEGQYCPNPNCRAGGRAGEWHSVIPRQKERRSRGKRCGRTFSATRDPARDRLPHPVEMVVTG
jgi:hypothetical protein